MNIKLHLILSVRVNISSIHIVMLFTTQKNIFPISEEFEVSGIFKVYTILFLKVMIFVN